LLAEDTEERCAEEQRGEQRQQRVVGERCRVVGDLVLAEAAEGTPEVTELERRTGLAAVLDGRLPISAQARCLPLPKRPPMP
jgi:hypothetical protein